MEEYKILAKSYKKLFIQTMNPIFHTMYSYILHEKTPIFLTDLTRENSLSQ